MSVQSPWRYPGGKARIAQKILAELEDREWTNFVEPFVGGGGFTLAALAHTPPGGIVQLNDADDRVAAWWEVVALGSDADFERLCCMVLEYEPTVKSFLQYRDKSRKSARLVEKSFAAFVTNRTSFSGILDAGPEGGYKQDGEWKINYKWRPEVSVDRHREVRKLLQQFDVRVEHKDFRDFLRGAEQFDTFWYLDPPYVGKGHRCYPTHFDLTDHEDLVWLVREHTDFWAISYDDTPWVREQYRDVRIIEIPVTYSVTAKRPGKIELLILPR